MQPIPPMHLVAGGAAPPQQHGGPGVQGALQPPPAPPPLRRCCCRCCLSQAGGLGGLQLRAPAGAWGWWRHCYLCWCCSLRPWPCAPLLHCCWCSPGPLTLPRRSCRVALLALPQLRVVLRALVGPAGAGRCGARLGAGGACAQGVIDRPAPARCRYPRIRSPLLKLLNAGARSERQGVS